MAWEAEIDLVHARYEREGRASVVKNPPPMRVVSPVKGGQFVAYYEKGGPPDYSVQAAGIAYLFDAKRHAGDRWPFSGLADHQAARFDAMGAA